MSFKVNIEFFKQGKIKKAEGIIPSALKKNKLVYEIYYQIEISNKILNTVS